MVPQAPTASKVPAAEPAPRAHASTQSRWPLFLSIFGALAVSALLWVGIIFGISVAIGWISGAN
jgi:hypothetical protein